MLKLSVVLSLVACALAGPVEVEQIIGNRATEAPEVPMLDGRIVGGVEVTISQYPWQLSLQSGSRHICGASIISANWALTAAHCVSGSSVSSLSLRAGSTQHASGGNVHTLASGLVHGSYSSRTLDYDIAVLRTSSAFSLGSTGIRAVSLLSAGSSPSTGALAYVSGWGTLSSGGSIPATLRAVDVPIVSQTSCRSSYGTSAITDRMLCAGYAAGGKDACQGDSGGPLVVNSVQVGIVSWGYGCAVAGYPGVYAHVGALRSWISSNTGV
ncbi:Serine protease [Rhyzopertha dominica]|nr:Serine protease [Rhyzopertha dominica]